MLTPRSLRFPLALCCALALAAAQARAAVVVLLDDSLSMAERRKDRDAPTCFDAAKRLVKGAAGRAARGERFLLLLATRPGKPIFDQPLDDESRRQLEKVLAETKCTVLRAEPRAGVEAAGKLLGGDGPRTLHVVSDFRARDWTGPEAAPLVRAVAALLSSGVNVNLVDAAGPLAEKAAPPENLAILELAPETRVAAQDVPVQFNCKVANFGAAGRKDVVVHVAVDGVERKAASTRIAELGPGKAGVCRFSAAFPKPGVGRVTAWLDDEGAGLAGDNVRHAAVEVRKELRVLAIDGKGAAAKKAPGDTFYLETLLKAARHYQLATGGAEELEKDGLRQYVAVYLLNVPLLPEKALKNLEDYAQNGGSVVFFLGDRVKAGSYNRLLYKDGKGLFPAPLANRAAQFPETADEKVQRALARRSQVLVRDYDHPAFAPLREARPFLPFVSVERYYPVAREKWKPAPGQVEEWVSLANRGGMDDCKDEATRLYRRLPAKDPKYKDYQAGLERHQWAIRRAIVLGKQARDLEEALSALLEDRGDPDAPDRPDMVEFWSKPELKALRADVITLRDKVRFGDPLVLSKRFGRGRVVASLTTLGPAWNDWASGPAAPAFVVMILEMQNYLLGASGRDCLTGSRAAVEADAARFEPKARCAYLPNRPHSGEGKAQDLGELLGNVAGGRVTITLDDTSRPGVYLFRLKPRGGGAEEVRAVAVNVDPAESDLERAPAAALEKLAPGGKGKLTLYRSEGRR